MGDMNGVSEVWVIKSTEKGDYMRDTALWPIWCTIDFASPFPSADSARSAMRVHGITGAEPVAVPSTSSARRLVGLEGEVSRLRARCNAMTAKKDSAEARADSAERLALRAQLVVRVLTSLLAVAADAPEGGGQRLGGT